MQKKLYFLNEEEKNRILNLHKSRTKNQYIINKGVLNTEKIVEQSVVGAPNQGVIKNSPSEKSSQQVLEKKFFDNRYKRAESLDEMCSKFPNQFTWTKLYDKISIVLMERNNQWNGPNSFDKLLPQLNTVKEYCQLNNSLMKGGIDPESNRLKKSYSSTFYGKGLATYIAYKCVYPSSWVKWFEIPLDKVLKDAGIETLNSVQNKSSSTSTKSWTDFAKIETDPITQQNQQYSGERRWMSMGSKYDEQILTALGKSGNKLSDDDIKDIYNKLKDAGKIK
jgi:hypothetical protein